MSCSFSHTKYQPSDPEFACPKCHVQAPTFCIDDCVNGTCDLIHPEDLLRCYNDDCRYEITGKEFTRQLAKRASMEKCPACKGSGLVKKGKR